jgi:hypothetical protein
MKECFALVMMCARLTECQKKVNFSSKFELTLEVNFLGVRM